MTRLKSNPTPPCNSNADNYTYTQQLQLPVLLPIHQFYIYDYI